MSYDDYEMSITSKDLDFVVFLFHMQDSAGKGGGPTELH